MTIKTYSPLQGGLGNWINNSKPVHNLKDADVVLIPGGADLNPTLYGHSRLASTYVNPEADIEEMTLINKAIEAGKLVVGICKGSQALTARAGGWLIQHVTAHGGNHEVTTYKGDKLTVTSTHHQMCYPYDLPQEDYRLLAWAEQRSSVYVVASEKDAHVDPACAYDADARFREPEVIWYPKIRGLGCQPHPEYLRSPEFNEWLNSLIIDFL